MPNPIPEFRRMRSSFLPAIGILIIIFSVGTTYSSINFSLALEQLTTVTSPPVLLEAGTAGSTVIYTNSTSAKVSVRASIGFDNSSSGTNSIGSASVSWNHTTGSGVNRIMIVGVSIRNTTISVSSITYGTQSLTFIRRDTHASSTIRSELWYLVAPASGTAKITVTLSGFSKATGGSCTYTGVSQTSPIDANAGGTGTSNSPSKNITVNTLNSWLLGHLAISGSGQTISSEGSGQTMRWDQVTSGGPAASRNRGHGSDKGPAATGNQPMSWTFPGAADWAVSIVAVKLVADFDCVAKVANQVSDAWKIRLRAYSQFNITRLNNCTIYFHNSSDATSRQVYIQNGAYVNQTGLWYDLPPSLAERYIAISFSASNSQTSHIYVYLEILVPNKSTYAQYIVEFEIN